MCDLKDEEVTYTETWKKRVKAEGSEGGGMFQREETAYVRVLDA